jgi:hypothetical protein
MVALMVSEMWPSSGASFPCVRNEGVIKANPGTALSEQALSFEDCRGADIHAAVLFVLFSSGLECQVTRLRGSHFPYHEVYT